MPDDPTPGGDQTGGTNDGAGGREGTGGDTGRRGSEESVLADLARERDRRQAAEREARRARELEAELARLRESSMSDQEKAQEKVRREVWAEAQKAFHTRLLQAEVRASAAGKLADPEDAIRFLDLADFSVDDDGKVDKKAITKALDELVKAKPYLAASATRPTGDADQGTRGTSGGASMNDLIKAAITRR